jgi:hypothetical protein
VLVLVPQRLLLLLVQLLLMLQRSTPAGTTLLLSTFYPKCNLAPPGHAAAAVFMVYIKAPDHLVLGLSASSTAMTNTKLQ